MTTFLTKTRTSLTTPCSGNIKKLTRKNGPEKSYKIPATCDRCFLVVLTPVEGDFPAPRIYISVKNGVNSLIGKG